MNREMVAKELVLAAKDLIAAKDFVAVKRKTAGAAQFRKVKTLIDTVAKKFGEDSVESQFLDALSSMSIAVGRGNWGVVRALGMSLKDLMDANVINVPSFRKIYKLLEMIRAKFPEVSDEALFIGIARDMALYVGRGQYPVVKRLYESIKEELDSDFAEDIIGLS